MTYSVQQGCQCCPKRLELNLYVVSASGVESGPRPVQALVCTPMHADLATIMRDEDHFYQLTWS